MTIPQPPADLVARIGGSMEIGRNQVEVLKMDGLRPEEDVLDVGCGMGRTAIALTSYLSPEGSYEGLDPHRGHIEWAQREITSRFPNFRFTHVDVFHSWQNSEGTIQPGGVTFPYESEQFDVVFLHSVFTHILSEGLERYCSEIARVLRPGGRLWATFFLLNDASITELRSLAGDKDAAGHNLAERLLKESRPCRTGYDSPERMVAYEEWFARHAIENVGLRIDQIRYGNWMKLSDGTPHGVQDGILAMKDAAA